MAIRNIVFDIGNVLADYRWEGYLQDKGFSPEMIARIAKASTLNPAWNEYDRGVLTSEEVVELFVRNDPGIEKELHFAFDSLAGIIRPLDYSVAFVRSLKAAGYHAYYLSNYSQRAWEDCPDGMPFLPEMDGGIFSYRVQLIKPDPAIYRLLLSRYGLKAEECVFLDDRADNVEGARRVGMQGIVFRSPEQALDELRRLGVTI